VGATIDPHGTPTSYYFQYATSSTTGCTPASCTTTPAAPGTPLGSGVGDVQVAPRHVQGLTPGGVYHYRVVAVSQLEVNSTPTAVSFAGPDHTFTTQAAGGALTLPDARQWELVSPPDKHGALLLPIGEVGVTQASAAGGGVTYLANLPTEERVKGYLFLGVQVLSTRGLGGWSSQDVSLPHATAASFSPGIREYNFFSPDLSAGLVVPWGEFSSLAPEAFPPDTERTQYVRHDSTCAATPATCFQPLLTSAPGYADVPEGTKFGGSEFTSAASFVGATPDLAHAILGSGLALTKTSTNSEELYEWSAGTRSPTTARASSGLNFKAEGTSTCATRPGPRRSSLTRRRRSAWPKGNAAAAK